MKIFHSELSANPGFFSFGYSVYAHLEPSDSLSDVYEAGFLPSVVLADEPDVFYMTRGTRVVVQEFKERHKLGRVARKIEELTPKISVTVHERKNFPITDTFVDFCLRYFSFRHGNGSMPKERLLAILASPFLTHISEYKLGDTTVAYILEVHDDAFIHSWYYAYDKAHEGSHLGAYLLLDLIRRAKTAGKKYAYMGVTYGPWMHYKTNYQPLQYWNGHTWVTDPKSEQLKKLLATDRFRTLTMTDAWRDTKKPFYAPLYNHGAPAYMRRALSFFATRYPKIFGFTMITLALIAGVWVFASLF